MPLVFANPTAKAYYEKSLACESSSRWLKAIENCRLAAETEPTHPEVWYRLGQLLARPESGAECGCDGYVAATKCVATTAEEYYWRAKAQEARAHCIAEDYPEDVLADYESCLSLDPTNLQYAFDRAVYYQELGRFSEALVEYNTLIASQPEDALYLFARGLLYQQHDQLTEAILDYDASLVLEHSAAALETRDAREVSLTLHHGSRVVRTYSLLEARGVLHLLNHDFKRALKDFSVKKSTGFNWWDIGNNIGYLIAYPAPGKPEPAARFEAAMRALEASGLINSTHPTYLEGRCRYFHYRTRYDPRPGLGHLALADADAIIAAKPNRYEYRELRVQCLLNLESPEPEYPNLESADLERLAHDYQWLAAQPLPAAKILKQLGKYARIKTRLTHTEYLHKNAWTQFLMGNHAASLESFEAAVASPLHVADEEDIEQYLGQSFYINFLPPLPAEDYVLWQIRQQLPKNREGLSSHEQVQNWLQVAIIGLASDVNEVLRPAFEKYRITYLSTGISFVHPRTAEHYSEAVALCVAGAQQVPAIADIFAMMHLNILKGQLRQALNQEGATQASREAALTHYDAARADLPGHNG